MKSGVETLSGLSMEGVRVHYNSSRPAQLRALAYTQGSDIHLAPGQARHLPHEAWHVVQQAQGRVRPTAQLQGGVALNDDRRLEREADAMGKRAASQRSPALPPLHRAEPKSSRRTLIAQRFEGDYDAPLEAGKLAEKQAEGIPEQALTGALKLHKWRKLNRLAGQITRSAANAPQLDLAALKGLLGQLMQAAMGDAPNLAGIGDELPDQILAECARLVTAASALELSANDFEIVSMFGPLEHWLTGGAKNDVAKLLRTLRHKMASRQGIGVVAHRGNGPTNRTRGGLIAQDDPRRLNREAENSPNAFAKAYEMTTAGGLDGVECDVFLSKDGVPMLSHEGAVREQLSLALQALHPEVTAATHIEDLTAEELGAIQRTDKAGSNFITLAQFLASAAETAEVYYQRRRKPFRIEIEMKGKPGSAVESPLRNPATYKQTLKKTVAKTISQFKKKGGKGIPMEFIVFNNDKDDARSFADLRAKKSQLGNLYTGLGSESSTDGNQAGVDELRMNAKAGLTKIGAKKYNDFILTLVPGAEAPVKDDEARPTLPFKALQWSPSKAEMQSWLDQNPQGNPETIATYTKQIKYIETVDADMAGQGAFDEETIDAILKKTATAKAVNVHLLTDTPSNGPQYALQYDLAAREAELKAVKDSYPSIEALHSAYPAIQDWDLALKDYQQTVGFYPETTAKAFLKEYRQDL